jgi:hypothetical protein
VRVLPFFLPIMMVACTTPERWTKAGADRVITAKDTEACQSLGKEEAQRRYPYMAGSGSYGPTAMVLSQQQDENNRASVQAGVFNECMRKKGYARV